jgi:ribosomal protein S27AE
VYNNANVCITTKSRKATVNVDLYRIENKDQLCVRCIATRVTPDHTESRQLCDNIKLGSRVQTVGAEVRYVTQ